MVHQFKNRNKNNGRDGSLETRIKLGNFIIAIISGLGVIISGVIAVGTYRQNSIKEEAAQYSEQKMRKYNQLKELYSQLVDTAASVGSAGSRQDALAKLNEFDRLYFGKAHIYVMDDEVMKEKIKFYWSAHELVETESFPSRKISLLALDLSTSCKQSLELMLKDRLIR